MVRPFRPADLPVIMDIGNRAWRDIYRMFHDAYGDELFQVIVPAPMAVKGEQVRSHCQTHPEWTLVCEEQGKVVGFVTFQLIPQQGIGVIGNNAVDPECGLKGCGQQMYQAVFEYFRRHGMRFAKVTTGMDWAHARARRAYERAGFNIRHEDVSYYREL